MRFGSALSGHTIVRAMLCACALATMSVHAATRISNAESVDLSALTSTARTGQQKKSDHLTTQFEAFDRHFDLQLQVNSKWSAAQSASSALALYRGAVSNESGSWVRLSVDGADVHGLIWDGHDLYIVEPRAEVSSALISQPDTSASNVIFRLADTLLDPGSTSCAVEDAIGKSDYGSLIGELKTQVKQLRAPGATLKLDLAILGDSDYLARYPSKQAARDAILVRLNNIDGIYSSQLGVEIQAPTVLVDDSTTDHVSSEADPSKLLAELANVRRNTPELRSAGVTHLFTGRDLQGTTVGIAYVDALCDQKYAVGLTQVGDTGVWIDSLIAAHEIGHNFGAVHDGEAGKACASTPSGVYLMSPAVSGNQAFSDCSLGLIRPKVQSATCISPLSPANVSIAADLGTAHHALNTAFDWKLTIANEGGIATTATHAQITLPAALTINSASVADGTCTSGAGVIDCDLGNLAGAGSRTITLSLQAASLGSYSVNAAVFAQNDSYAFDNAGSGSIDIATMSDLSIAINAPATVNVHDSFALSFNVVNSSAQAVSNVVVLIPTAAAFAVGQSNFTGGQCQLSNGAVTCTLAQLDAGATTTGTVALVANQEGTYSLAANLSADFGNGQSGNDHAQAAVTVSTSPTATVTNSTTSAPKSTGGGGSMSLLLMGLAALGLVRRGLR